MCTLKTKENTRSHIFTENIRRDENQIVFQSSNDVLYSRKNAHHRPPLVQSSAGSRRVPFQNCDKIIMRGNSRFRPPPTYGLAKYPRAHDWNDEKHVRALVKRVEKHVEQNLRHFIWCLMRAVFVVVVVV